MKINMVVEVVEIGDVVDYNTGRSGTGICLAIKASPGDDAHCAIFFVSPELCREAGALLFKPTIATLELKDATT